MWRVDAEDALRDLEDRLVGRPDLAGIVVSCEDYAIEWVQSGPPSEAEYRPDTETWFCDVPGTPVVCEHIKAVFSHPPAVQILRFHFNAYG
jgi:hypothetical protein